mgnify:CR=1 FL=1
MNDMHIFLIAFIFILCCCYCIKISNYNDNAVNLFRKRFKERMRAINDVVRIYNKNDDSILICPITQENIENGEVIKELPCGHKFSRLIDRWIYEENDCPICRESVIEMV